MIHDLLSSIAGLAWVASCAAFLPFAEICERKASFPCHMRLWETRAEWLQRFTRFPTDDIITAADEAFESAVAVRAFAWPLGTIMPARGGRRDHLEVVDYHDQPQDLTSPFSEQRLGHNRSYGEGVNHDLSIRLAAARQRIGSLLRGPVA